MLTNSPSSDSPLLRTLNSQAPASPSTNLPQESPNVFEDLLVRHEQRVRELSQALSLLWELSKNVNNSVQRQQLSKAIKLIQQARL